MTTVGTRPLVAQFAWVSLGRVVAALLQAVLLVLAARSLAPEQFGRLAAVLGVATVLQMGLDFGITTFVVRERAADPDSGAIATALRFNSATSLVMMLLSGAALLVAGAAGDGIYLEMLPLALWVSGERNADTRLAVALADGDARINTANLVARRTGAIAAYLALLVVVPPVLAFSLATGAAALASAVFANAHVRRRVTAAPTLSVGGLLRRSWPYWLNSFATQARNLDVIVTGLLAGASQAGFYSAGSRLTSPLRILPTSLATVLLPATARHAGGSDDLRPVLRATTAAVGAMTVLYAVVFLATPEAVRLVLGSAYRPATGVIQIVVAGLPFAAAASLLGSLLQGLGRSRRVATISTATTTACLVLIVVLAPTGGARGAAVALSLSFALQTVLLAIEVSRVTPPVRAVV